MLTYCIPIKACLNSNITQEFPPSSSNAIKITIQLMNGNHRLHSRAKAHKRSKTCVGPGRLVLSTNNLAELRASGRPRHNECQSISESRHSPKAKGDRLPWCPLLTGRTSGFPSMFQTGVASYFNFPIKHPYGVWFEPKKQPTIDLMRTWKFRQPNPMAGATIMGSSHTAVNYSTLMGLFLRGYWNVSKVCFTVGDCLLDLIRRNVKVI